MQWTGEPGAGFTEPGVEPWLPFGDFAACNVADQRHDPDSMLSLTRDLIGLRDAMPELRDGAYRTLPAPERRRVGVAARRAHRRRVQPARTKPVDGRRRRARRDPDLDRSAPATTSASTARSHLAPWEAAIVWRD